MIRLLYVSPVPWHGLEQRPHRLARWFHRRTSGRVLWIDPYPVRLPRLSDVRRPPSGPTSCVPCPGWLEVLAPRALPVEPIPGVERINHLLWRSLIKKIADFLRAGPCLVGVGKPSALSSRILRMSKERERILTGESRFTVPEHLKGSGFEKLFGRGPFSPPSKESFFKGGVVTFYDAMDAFPHFFDGISRRAMARREEDIAALVDIVLASTDALVRRFGGRPRARRVTLVPNACEASDLPKVEDLCPSVDRRGFGYVGTMARWFDWTLVRTLAEFFPSDPVTLIGPVFCRPRGDLPSNVIMRPPQASRHAMASMARFAVGMIPFVCNDLTNAVDPIKYYEYAALGLPILSTSFGGMDAHRGKPGVFLAENPAEWVRLAQAAKECKEVQDPSLFRSENSWEVRFDSAGLLSEL